VTWSGGWGSQMTGNLGNKEVFRSGGLGYLLRD